MEPRWRTVFFDLDGTLADTIQLIVTSFNHTLATLLDETRSETEIRSWIGRSLLETFEAISPERAVELESFYREWNVANTDRLIRRYAGVPALLQALSAARVTTGVVTSKRRATAEKAMSSVGISGLVPLLVGMEDTDAHKPDPAPLLHAASIVGVEPRTCAYVGDATVDVLAARAAGMAAVGVSWGATSRESLEALAADAVVDSPNELAELLHVSGTNA